MPDVPGIDAITVPAWLESNVGGAIGPFTFELIEGGRSNLTYRVSDSAGHRYVLRRPPLGHVLATAHDMAREHRIISAVGA
ncbi:MAG: phosphotransferase family protein, partial [Ilumatobacteraceae bacterium]